MQQKTEAGEILASAFGLYGIVGQTRLLGIKKFFHRLGQAYRTYIIYRRLEDPAEIVGDYGGGEFEKTASYRNVKV